MITTLFRLSSLDLAVVLASGLFMVVFKHVKRGMEPVTKMPCPPSKEAHWLWGHEYTIWEGEASRKYFEWTELLGPVFRVKAAFFQRDVIVAGDAASSTHVLQYAYKYEKAPGFLPITVKLLGRGVVWAHGDEHKHQRKLITPAFTVSAVRGMEADVFESSEKLVNRLKSVINSQGDGTVVNIEPHVASCTLDVIGRIAFGHDFGSGESSDAKAISAAWHKDVVLGRTFAGFLAPILIGSFPWINSLPIPALQEDGVTKQIAMTLATRILAENRENLKVGGGRDILSILVRDSEQKKKETGVALEDWQLLENISTFIMVGHETTSCSIIFTLLELARHPEVQKKLRAEIRALNDFNYEDLSKLEYLDAVTKEGLRLHPASPRTDRIALQDDIIPLSTPIQMPGGKTITEIPVKAGQVIQIPLSVLNCNPAIWGADAYKFKPERFLTLGGTPDAENLPRGPYSNLATFIDGPRTCIGWRLAIMEFKVILAILVRDFVFEETGAKIEEYISGTLQAFCEGKGANMPLKIRLAA